MDIHCAVCGEPWEAYGQGDMKPWEWDLFKKGAGCPCCEGVSPAETKEEQQDITFQHAKDALDHEDPHSFETFNRCLGGEIPTDRPKWERPEDPVVWKCAGCGLIVRMNLDGGDYYDKLYYDEKSAADYIVRANEREADPEEEPPFTIENEGYCRYCCTVCSECGATVFQNPDLIGDTYQPGSSFPHPFNHRDTVCVDCFEKFDSCGNCGETFDTDDDPEFDDEGRCKYCKPEIWYRVTFHSHCGMAGIPFECGDKDDARAEAADRLRRARKLGGIVSILKRGKEWEVTEPEDSVMVPDWAGILVISTYEKKR